VKTASERGRANRDRGVRFERKLARLFKAEGFTARRILEFDRGAGVDLEVGVVLRPFSKDHPLVTHWLPVAIQAKATNRPSDLQTGLTEAMTGRPNAKLWVCIQTYKRQLRILTLSPDLPVPQEASWESLINEIKDLSPLLRP
jgi:hypothetical protein